MKATPEYLRTRAAEMRIIAEEMERRAVVIEQQAARCSRQSQRHFERKVWAALSPASRYAAACESCRTHPLTKALAIHFDIRIEQLCDKVRKQPLALYRQIAMYLLTQGNLSTTEVGEMLDRDHSTVMSGLRIIEKRMKIPAFRQSIDRIKEIARRLEPAKTCAEPEVTIQANFGE